MPEEFFRRERGFWLTGGAALAGFHLGHRTTTLVGRSEERDLVDVLFLERAGYRVENAMADGARKDGSCTPATLAWLLSQLRIPDGLELPAQISSTQLREFVAELVVRLRRLAAPGG